MPERVILVVGYDGAELLDIACVTSSLDIANRIGASPPYRSVLATPGGQPITCDSGLQLAAQATLEQVRGPVDTLLVSGGLGHRDAAENPVLVGHVRRLAALSRRVASVCTGATVLAEAGLLTNKRVTTHWMYAEQLARNYPEIIVDPDPIYVRDGDVATSGGVTSALDLTLAFVEDDHGMALARGVALGVVAYLQRPGAQAQLSMFLTRRDGDDLVVRRTTSHIVSNLADDLTAGALAKLAGVSERHLSRLFLTYVRETPAQYVRRARTEAAAHLLASTGMPLPAIARRCGFGSTETMRQAFVTHYGVPPSAYRRNPVGPPTESDPPVPAPGYAVAGAARSGS